jgi:hypothetical protein
VRCVKALVASRSRKPRKGASTGLDSVSYRKSNPSKFKDLDQLATASAWATAEARLELEREFESFLAKASGSPD